jgi:hypothetical protein
MARSLKGGGQKRRSYLFVILAWFGVPFWSPDGWVRWEF